MFNFLRDGARFASHMSHPRASVYHGSDCVWCKVQGRSQVQEQVKPQPQQQKQQQQQQQLTQVFPSGSDFLITQSQGMKRALIITGNNNNNDRLVHLWKNRLHYQVHVLQLPISQYQLIDEWRWLLQQDTHLGCFVFVGTGTCNGFDLGPSETVSASFMYSNLIHRAQHLRRLTVIIDTGKGFTCGLPFVYRVAHITPEMNDPVPPITLCVKTLPAHRTVKEQTPLVLHVLSCTVPFIPFLLNVVDRYRLRITMCDLLRALQNYPAVFPTLESNMDTVHTHSSFFGIEQV